MKLLRPVRVIAVLAVVVTVLIYLTHPATLDTVIAGVSRWLAGVPEALQPLTARIRPTLAKVTFTQLLIGAAVAWFVFVLVLVLLARSARPRQATADTQGPPPEQLRPAQGDAGALPSTPEMQPQMSGSYTQAPPLAPYPDYDTPRAPVARLPNELNTSLDPSLDPSFADPEGHPGGVPRVMPFAVPAASLRGGREPEYVEWPPPTSPPGFGPVMAPHPETPMTAGYLGHGHVAALTGVSPAGNRLLPYGLFFIAEDAEAPTTDGASSKRALQLIMEDIVASLVNSHTLSSEQLAALLDFAVIRATINLRQQGIADASQLEAHVAGLMIVDTRAFGVNVGDYRTYLVRHGSGITPMMPDHSLISSVVQSDRREPETANSNDVTRRMREVEGTTRVDGFHIGMQAHDLFVLCSASLSHVLGPQQIEAILRAAPTLSGAAQMLTSAGKGESVAVIVRAAPHQLPQFGLASHHVESGLDE